MMQPPVMPMQPQMRPAGPNWTALRIVAVLLKIAAWFELVIGIVGSIFVALIVSSIGSDSVYFNVRGLPVMLAAVVGSIVFFLMMYAFADLIMLLVAIENNTRKY